MRQRLQRRWPWLAALLMVVLLAHPAAASAQPADRAQTSALASQPADDGGLTGRSRQCADQQTTDSFVGEQPEHYAYVLCVVLRDPPDGQVGVADQQVHAELSVITDGGQIRAAKGVLRLCHGRGVDASRGLNDACFQATRFGPRAGSPDVTALSTSNPVPCTDPDFDASPYFAVLTNFHLLGSHDSGFEVDFSDQARPSATFGEITPTVTAARCTSDTAEAPEPAQPDGADERQPCVGPNGTPNPLCRRSTTPSRLRDAPLVWRLV